VIGQVTKEGLLSLIDHFFLENII